MVQSSPQIMVTRSRVEVKLPRDDSALGPILRAACAEIIETWGAAKTSNKYPEPVDWRFSEQLKHIGMHHRDIWQGEWVDGDGKHTHIGAILTRAAIMAKDYHEGRSDLNDVQRRPIIDPSGDRNPLNLEEADGV